MFTREWRMENGEWRMEDCIAVAKAIRIRLNATTFTYQFSAFCLLPPAFCLLPPP